MSMFGRKRKMMGDPNTAENIDLYRSQQGMSAPQERTGPNWGEIGRNVLGNIGDAISTYYGGAPTFAPLQRQALAFQQQGQLLAERQRQQAALQAQRAADQRSLAEYRATLPTAMERNLNANSNFTPQQRATYDELNPVVVATGAGPVRVPRGVKMPTSGAIDYLRKNPNLAEQFDAKYGVGSAARYLGK